jgi:DNA-binding transcriptional regulator PaaX
MPKPLSSFSLTMLKALHAHKRLNKDSIEELYKKDEDPKKISAAIYRLEHQGLIEKSHDSYFLTEDGEKVIHIYSPSRDGVWKLIIFDIPESERYVRTILRQRLQTLGFKKWQNSIWASPYILDPALEKELKLLAKRYFVRLIKTTDINDTADLEALFPGETGPSSPKIDRPAK